MPQQTNHYHSQELNILKIDHQIKKKLPQHTNNHNFHNQDFTHHNLKTKTLLNAEQL